MSLGESLIYLKKFIFLYLDAKILLGLIFLIFLILVSKFILPFLKEEFDSSSNKIKLSICKYQQLFIYHQLIFLLIGSLILTFLKKINFIFIKINYLYLYNYLNIYFYVVNLILINIFNDFNNLVTLKKNILNLSFFKNSLRNFFYII